VPTELKHWSNGHSCGISARFGLIQLQCVDVWVTGAFAINSFSVLDLFKRCGVKSIIVITSWTPISNAEPINWKKAQEHEMSRFHYTVSLKSRVEKKKKEGGKERERVRRESEG